MLNRENAPVVLVVDDECFARLFAVQILLDAGFMVLEARDAAEAVEMLHENSDVQVLITDITMPGALDGWDVVAEARRLQPALRVIVTSGAADPGEGLRVPVDSFVAKPFTAGAFIDALAGVVPVLACPRIPSMTMLARA
jgi:CheY-like chemotaxis protein